jgi:hypothetical protein
MSNQIMTYNNVMGVLVGAYTAVVVYQILTKPDQTNIDQAKTILGSAIAGVVSHQIWPFALIYHSLNYSSH